MNATCTPEILFHADGIIAVNKPAGIPTSGRSLDDDDAVQFHLAKTVGQPVWAVHQLDADTSGVNLFCTEKRLVAPLKDGLADPASRKIYLAIVHGSPHWDTIDCHAPIGPINERSLGVSLSGKAARSRFTVLDRANSFALICAEIFTGRTHQIRIHLTHLGFPLVGDDWYGVQTPRLHHRQALHAYSISLKKLEYHFTAPLPSDLNTLGDQLELKRPEQLVRAEELP